MNLPSRARSPKLTRGSTSQIPHILLCTARISAEMWYEHVILPYFLFFARIVTRKILVLKKAVFTSSSTVLKRSNVKSVPRRRAPPRRHAPGNRIIRCEHGAGFSRRAFPASQRVVRKLGVAGSLRRVERIRKSKIATTVFSSLRQLLLKKGVFSRLPQIIPTNSISSSA